MLLQGFGTRDPLARVVRYATRFFSTPAATLTKPDPALLRSYLLLLGSPYVGQNKNINSYLIQRPESFRWN